MRGGEEGRGGNSDLVECGGDFDGGKFTVAEGGEEGAGGVGFCYKEFFGGKDAAG